MNLFIVSMIRMLLLVSTLAWFWSHYIVMTLNLMNQIHWASSAPFIKVRSNWFHEFFSFRVRVCIQWSLRVPYYYQCLGRNLLSFYLVHFVKWSTSLPWGTIAVFCYQFKEHSSVISCLWLFFCSILDPKINFSEVDTTLSSPRGDLSSISETLSSYAMEQLEAYTNNLVDYRMVRSLLEDERFLFPLWMSQTFLVLGSEWLGLLFLLTNRLCGKFCKENSWMKVCEYNYT